MQDQNRLKNCWLSYTNEDVVLVHRITRIYLFLDKGIAVYLVKDLLGLGGNILLNEKKNGSIHIRLFAIGSFDCILHH